jgi:hypothetical protein
MSIVPDDRTCGHFVQTYMGIRLPCAWPECAKGRRSWYVVLPNETESISAALHRMVNGGVQPVREQELVRERVETSRGIEYLWLPVREKTDRGQGPR